MLCGPARGFVVSSSRSSQSIGSRSTTLDMSKVVDRKSGPRARGVDVRMTTTGGAEYRRVPFPMMNASLPRQLWPIDRWWQDE
jgi:hypothetical protein